MIASGAVIGARFFIAAKESTDSLVFCHGRSFFTLNNRYMHYRPMGPRHAV